MSQRNFILTILGVLLIEQFLFAVFNWQSRASLLAIFILAATFLDQHFGEKLGWAVFLLLFAEFKTGGQWGILPLALLLTLLAIVAMGKILSWPVKNLFFSAGWIFVWHAFFTGTYLGLETMMSGYEGWAGRWQDLWITIAHNFWPESAVVISGFVVYLKLIKAYSGKEAHYS